MDIHVDPVDDELNRFERDIHQLKIEYEQFFGGGKKRPPTEVEWRLELVLKRHGDRGAAMNYGQRFRYHNLAQTYARYRDMFRKRMRKHEEGSVERHFGAAARAIQAARNSGNAKAAVPVTIACADPTREPKKVDAIYDAFRECLTRSGESVERLSREHFDQFLRRKVAQLRKQKGAGEVEFIVGIEGGKASLKARVKT